MISVNRCNLYDEQKSVALQSVEFFLCIWEQIHITRFKIPAERKKDITVINMFPIQNITYWLFNQKRLFTKHLYCQFHSGESITHLCRECCEQAFYPLNKAVWRTWLDLFLNFNPFLSTFTHCIFFICTFRCTCGFLCSKSYNNSQVFFKKH